jgi:formylglycine-generating enzyme required for sulfatase activity
MSELEAAFAALLDDARRDGDPAPALVLADWLLERGDARRAASALDRAFALRPDDAQLAAQRATLLDGLAVEEHGLRFRYVPAGSFLMGSDDGEPDERPVHHARTGGFWIADAPITWADYCRLMGWAAPPDGAPDDGNFMLREQNKIRIQYCESETLRALDWHVHVDEALNRDVPRSDGPIGYAQKPMVAASYRDAEDLVARLSTATIAYRLPTELEWEKAARGGLVGARYAWGDAPPDAARCDFGRFGDFRIVDPRTFPPNGYGLHAMCGTVWEWTADDYDALAYRSQRPPASPTAERARVLRGGSWSDCAEACTVSFRMSRPGNSWRDGDWGDHFAPNFGFRIARFEI